MRKIVIGVMGAGEEATNADCKAAYELGRLIAEAGWILLTGGRNVGVMDAASRGAHQAGGLTVGILPGNTREGMSESVDVAIVTGIGNARNNINVLSSDIVVACGGRLGTVSEIALAIKANKQVILLNPPASLQNFFQNLSEFQVYVAATSQDVMQIIREILQMS